METKTTRPLCEIARDIKKSWKNVSPYAQPYIDAMLELYDINDNYYDDSGQSVVRYALSNMATFRGEDAKRLKAELKSLLK